MNYTLLKLRFLQLYREAGEIGIFRVLFVLVLILPVTVVFLVQKIAVHPYPIMVPAIAVYLVWLAHQTRKDYRFLLGLTPSPARIFFAEYCLFTLPVTVLLLSNLLWIHTLVFLFLLRAVAGTVPQLHQTISGARFPWLSGNKKRLKFKMQMSNVKVQSSERPLPPLSVPLFSRLLPQGMFEWQSGIRKNGVVLLLFYLVGIAGFWHIGFVAIALFMLTLVITSFFSEMEPLPMLRAGEETAGRFILKKLARNIFILTILMMPLLGVALVHPEFAWYATGYYFASLNLLAFAILLKYNNYRPCAISGVHQLITTLVCTVSVILPVAILVLAVNLILWAGAARNLRSFLNG